MWRSPKFERFHHWPRHRRHGICGNLFWHDRYNLPCCSSSQAIRVYGSHGIDFWRFFHHRPLTWGADKAPWRWCFYIKSKLILSSPCLAWKLPQLTSNSLPLGAIAVSILLFTLRSSSSDNSVSIQQQIAQLDPIGTLVFLPGLFCFLLALECGGSIYA